MPRHVECEAFSVFGSLRLGIVYPQITYVQHGVLQLQVAPDFPAYLDESNHVL
jgi:hypothetical protein